MNLKITEDAPILCPECEHDINDANRDPDFQDQCRVFPCVCTLTPYDIAARHAEWLQELVDANECGCMTRDCPCVTDVGEPTREEVVRVAEVLHELDLSCSPFLTTEAEEITIAILEKAWHVRQEEAGR